MNKKPLEIITPNIAINLILSEANIDIDLLADDTKNCPLINSHKHTGIVAIDCHRFESYGMHCTIYVATPEQVADYYPFPSDGSILLQQLDLQKTLLESTFKASPIPPNIGNFKLITQHPEILAYYCITPYIYLKLLDLSTVFRQKTPSGELRMARELEIQRERQREETLERQRQAEQNIQLTIDTTTDITTTAITQLAPRIQTTAINWNSINQALSNEE